MKSILLALFVTAVSFQTFAQSPSKSEGRFCADRLDKKFVKMLALDSNNLMNFSNHGGLAQSGVCWWHSRFQRNALYLTIFKPNLPRASEAETYQIVKRIRAATEVVVITGYNNFSEFSSINQDIIQAELEKWQKGDGFVRFAWIKGLSGQAEVKPAKLKNLMDQIYQEVEVNKNISFNRLQIKGIDAHAWLVVSMQKFAGGYRLKVIDSNISDEPQTYTYREGETNIMENNFNFSFTPYIDQTSELKKINKTITDLCAQK